MRIQLGFIILNIFIIFSPNQFYCYRIDFEKNSKTEHLTRSYFSNYNAKIIEEIELRSSAITEIDENTFMEMTKLKYLHLSDNNIEHLPTYVFSNLTSLKELNLKFNKLQNLDEILFQNLTELTYLNLHSNNINIINKNLFANLKKLETLILYSNKISVIEMGTFDNNINLQYLDFYDNLVTEIKNGTFANLINLNKLHFSFNKIQNIGSHAFPLNSNITELLLAGNKLEYLSPTIILNLKKLKYLTLYYNPWNCDMKLKNLVNVCKNVDLKMHPLYSIPKCAKPKRLAMKKWNLLTDEDFPSLRTTTAPYDTLLIGAKVKLSCCLNDPDFDVSTKLEWLYEDDTCVVSELEDADRPFVFKYVKDSNRVLCSNITIHGVREYDAGVYKCVMKVWDDEVGYKVVAEESEELMF